LPVFYDQSSQDVVEPTVSTPRQSCRPQFCQESPELWRPSYSQPPCGWLSRPPLVGYE